MNGFGTSIHSNVGHPPTGGSRKGREYNVSPKRREQSERQEVGWGSIGLEGILGEGEEVRVDGVRTERIRRDGRTFGKVRPLEVEQKVQR